MTVDQLNTLYDLINQLNSATGILLDRARGTNDPLWNTAQGYKATIDSARRNYQRWHNESRR